MERVLTNVMERLILSMTNHTQFLFGTYGNMVLTVQRKLESFTDAATPEPGPVDEAKP
jgi:hypothetical protein